MPNKNILRIVIITILILMIPLIAMQFTDEVKWDFFDFIVMGILLLATGLTYEFFSRKAKTTSHKVAIAIAVCMGFILIWIELAVGIFGN